MTEAPDASEADGATCVPRDNSCTRCGDKYSCTDPRMELDPVCPAGANYGDPCSADCIMCGAPAAYGNTMGPLSATAWLLSCSDGTYQAVSFGLACTP